MWRPTTAATEPGPAFPDIVQDSNGNGTANYFDTTMRFGCALFLAVSDIAAD
ncbi:hypothetical protein MBRA_37880 [Mycobacterium branderi]|uniref:Uncharacterized protein n=1 Tax=Mycobacterium branderi TaxID=43348 RepID=A0ABM7KR42_9MYCO|nr:hypothetical protein MBRA_37880 [Mycobacterium branderi]